MLGIPNEPLPGQRIAAADIAQIIRYAKSGMARAAAGELVATGSGGTTRKPLRRHAVNQWPTNGPTTFPYQVTDASDSGGPKVTVRPGTHNNFMPEIDGLPLVPPVTNPATPAPRLALSTGATFVYVQIDFSFDTYGVITIADGSIHSTDSSVPTTTVTGSVGGGGGSGTFYEALATVSVTPATGGGVASVQVNQLINTVRTIYMCGQFPVVQS